MTPASNLCTCPSCSGPACTCGCQSPADRAAASCPCGDACACGPDCACLVCQCSTPGETEAL